MKQSTRVTIQLGTQKMTFELHDHDEAQDYFIGAMAGALFMDGNRSHSGTYFRRQFAGNQKLELSVETLAKKIVEFRRDCYRLSSLREQLKTLIDFALEETVRIV